MRITIWHTIGMWRGISRRIHSVRLNDWEAKCLNESLVVFWGKTYECLRLLIATQTCLNGKSFTRETYISVWKIKSNPKYLPRLNHAASKQTEGMWDEFPLWGHHHNWYRFLKTVHVHVSLSEWIKSQFEGKMVISNSKYLLRLNHGASKWTKGKWEELLLWGHHHDWYRFLKNICVHVLSSEWIIEESISREE